MEDGQALYTVMCRDDGAIVDDLIVYRESTERFFLCINASRRDEDFRHLLEVCGAYDCELTDVSERYAQIAVQGPKSQALLKKLDIIDSELTRASQKLSNENFMNKAPQSVIDKITKQKEDLSKEKELLIKQINQVQTL